MMIKFCLLVLILSFHQKASAEQPVIKPKFRISYFGSEEGQVYAHFMQKIYEELGFDVSIIPTPVKRGLILLNDNEVDADVIRFKSVAEKYENIVLVEPPIAAGILVLLCNKLEPCDESILQNKTVFIQSDEGNLNLFKRDEIQAQMIINEMTNNTINMLEEERILYALYSLNNKMLENFSSRFNYVKLKDVSGYHVINKKHAHLLSQIQQKIRQKLPALKASLN
jgi:hypothetical protein